MKNEQQRQNLLLKVDPGSTLSNNFLQMFLLGDKLITQGEKREKSTMLRDKFRVFVSRISPPLDLLAGKILVWNQVYTPVIESVKRHPTRS